MKNRIPSRFPPFWGQIRAPRIEISRNKSTGGEGCFFGVMLGICLKRMRKQHAAEGREACFNNILLGNIWNNRFQDRNCDFWRTILYRKS